MIEACIVTSKVLNVVMYALQRRDYFFIERTLSSLSNVIGLSLTEKLLLLLSIS